MNRSALDRWYDFLIDVYFVLKTARSTELTNFDKTIIIERLDGKKFTDQEISVFSKSHPMPKAVEKIVYEYFGLERS